VTLRQVAVVLQAPLRAADARILRGSQRNAAEAIRQASGRRMIGASPVKEA
jgi:hypothetical protein